MAILLPLISKKKLKEPKMENNREPTWERMSKYKIQNEYADGKLIRINSHHGKYSLVIFY